MFVVIMWLFSGGQQKYPPPTHHYSFSSNCSLIGSHRGHYLFPENTYESIKAASDVGFMIVEFDVQMTKDSVLVIHHDKTIDRCSNGTGTISECYFDQLNQYDYGSWKDLSFSGTKLATLESVLQLVKISNILVEIDMLYHDSTSIVINKVFDLVDKYKLMDNCSFNVTIENARRVCEMSNNRANISLQYQAAKLQEFPSVASKDHFTYCSIRKDRLTYDVYSFCKNNDIRLEVWGVNSEEELSNYLNMGCEYVMVEEFVPTELLLHNN